MKIRKITTYLSTAFIAVLMTLLFCVKITAETVVNSYYKTEYLDRDIPTNYYTVDTSSSQAVFRKTLHDDISKNYTRFNYLKAWEINDYCDADPLNERNVLCVYTGTTIHYQDGESGAIGSVWNREHVWAKSHGFNDDSLYPYSDCHHLRAAEKSTNSGRGNKDFGEVTSETGHDDYGNSWSTTLYEPRDEVKGDIARMMLYMAIRYGEYESAASDGTVFNLTLTDDLSQSVVSMGNGYFGTLSTLLKWHYEDPVSVREIYRNEVIYNMYQKNRNPFIDHPEYVNYAYADDVANLEGVDTNLYFTNPSVSNTSVNDTIALIDAIPKEITMDNLEEAKSAISAARTAYDSLNYKEEAEISNYIYLYALEAEAISVEKIGSASANPTSIDFEASSGYTATTSYQVATPRSFGREGVNDWNVVYGAVTATKSDVISGDQALTLAWYVKSSSVVSYAEMNYSVKNIKSVSFKAKGPVTLTLKLSYSIDAGESWIDVATYAMTTSAKTYSPTIADGELTGPVRLRFTLGTAETAPTANVRLDIDDIEITADTAMKQFENLSTKSSLKFNYSSSGDGSTKSSYQLVTDASTLKANDQIIIAALDYNVALGAQNGTYRDQISVTKTDNTLSFDAEPQIITLKTGSLDGTFAMSCGTNSYLAATSSSNNNLGTSSSVNGNSSWTFTIADTGEATIFANGTYTRNYLKYNLTSTRFSCYASTSTTMKKVAVYKYTVSSSYSYSNMYIRFGSFVDKTLYTDLLAEGSNVSFGVALSKDGTSFTKYECTPALVDETGKADLDGSYYQWAAVVAVPNTHYGDVLTAKGYVCIDDVYYYMDSAAYSVNTLAAYYVTHASTLGIDADLLGGLRG